MIGALLTDNLRAFDNPTLTAACKAAHGAPVMLFLLFTDEQLGARRASAGVFVDAVRELARTLPVSTFCGPVTTYARIVREHKLDVLYIARGHTPFAKQRARYLRKVMRGRLVEVEDRLLDWSALAHEYQVFSAFRNALAEHRHPRIAPARGPFHRRVAAEWPRRQSSTLASTTVEGNRLSPVRPAMTREAALQHLRRHFSALSRAHSTALRPSSGIGPYVRFGVISPREVWDLAEREKQRAKGGPQREQLTELQQGLVWREFFHYMTDRLGFAQLKPYRGPRWLDAMRMPHSAAGQTSSTVSARARFRLWCRGETGQRFVDLGMRQMAETGAMHNRLRMVTANYLVQHLRCNWRWGERFFAESLVDYDSGINCWSWQFIAGTGTDRYRFRPFNPDLQEKRFAKVLL